MPSIFNNPIVSRSQELKQALQVISRRLIHLNSTLRLRFNREDNGYTINGSNKYRDDEIHLLFSTHHFLGYRYERLKEDIWGNKRIFLRAIPYDVPHSDE